MSDTPPSSPYAVKLFVKTESLQGQIRATGGRQLPPAVAIAIDGQGVGARKTRADGGLGRFSWFIPSRYYDGALHTVAISLEGEAEDAAAPLSVAEFQLSAEDRPQLTSYAVLGEGGVLTGYVWDRGKPEYRQSVEVWENGALVEVLECGVAPPEGAPADAPHNCGFVFTPSDLASWMDGRSKLIVRKFEDVVSYDVTPFQRGYRIEDVTNGDAVIATVRHRLPAVDAFELLIDGEAITAQQQRRFDGFSQITIPRPAKPDRSRHTLTVHFVADGRRIASDTAVFHWETPRGWLNNARFDAWKGAGPAHWETADGVHTLPGQGDGRSNWMRIIPPEGAQSGAAQTLLTQGLAIEGRPDAIDIDLRIRGDAGAATAEVRDRKGSLGRLKTALVGQWTQRRESVALKRAIDGPASVVLSAPSPVDIALLDVGPVGFATPSSSAAAEEAREPLLTYGAMDRWPLGLRFAASRSAQNLAEGWRLNGDRADRKLQVYAARLPGLVGSDAGYGIALSGDVEKGRAILTTPIEARLSPAPGRRIELSFWCGPAEPLAGEAVAPSRINRIFVGTSPDEVGSDDVILATNVHVGPSAGRTTVPIGVTLSEALDAAFRASVASQTPLYLGFEFSNRRQHLVLGDVRLDRTTALAPEQKGFLGFEDFNLASQIHTIRGLELWRAAEPVKAAAPGALPQARPVAPIARWATSALPLCDVVVPVYNAEAHALQCLAALAQNTAIPHRVIVVDDASALSTAEALDAFVADKPWFTVIHNPENLGYTRSSNKGLRAGQAPFAVLLNSDTVVTRGWLEALLSAALRDEAIAMVGPLSNAATWQSVPSVKDPSGRWAVNAIPNGHDIQSWAEHVARASLHDYPEAPLLNGFCTLLRRSALDQIGYLDEVTFPVGYGEEVDLCIRLTKAGYKLVVADDVFVFHHKSSSFGAERRAPLAKEGGRNVRKKHSDVDIAALETQLAQTEALVAIRNRLNAGASR